MASFYDFWIHVKIFRIFINSNLLLVLFFRFNYTREDEEIYKEFLEIANELIPNIVKAVSANTTDRVQMNILYNPEVYADILRFYDGICEWEEGSSTPVLHVGWAQNLTFSLSKFDSQTRAKIDVGKDEDNDDDEGDDNDGCDEYKSSEKRARDTKDVGNEPQGEVSDLRQEESISSQRETPKGRKGPRRRNSSMAKSVSSESAGRSDAKINGDEQNEVEHKIKSTIEELASKIVQQDCSLDAAPNPSITALAQQCSVNILNKDYLLGAGEPFSSSPAVISDSSILDEALSSPLNRDGHCNGSDSHLTADALSNGAPNGSTEHTLSSSLTGQRNTKDSVSGLDGALLSPSDSPTASVESVHVELRSEKMKGLKKMFKSSKLNASAIKLQLTAQSQVHVKDSRFLDFGEPVGSARKRQKREVV